MPCTHDCNQGRNCTCQEEAGDAKDLLLDFILLVLAGVTLLAALLFAGIMLSNLRYVF